MLFYLKHTCKNPFFWFHLPLQLLPHFFLPLWGTAHYKRCLYSVDPSLPFSLKRSLVPPIPKRHSLRGHWLPPICWILGLHCVSREQLIPSFFFHKLSLLGPAGYSTCLLAVSWHIPALGPLHWFCSNMQSSLALASFKSFLKCLLPEELTTVFILQPTLFPKLLLFF